jgi:peroxiredoxin
MRLTIITHAYRTVALCGLLLCGALTSPASAGAADAHALAFASPGSADARAYLGISADTFTLAGVQADIVIVELFTLYCALCAREAPAVAELFSLAQKQSTPQRRIRVLGIGTGSSPDDVARFQQQHSVPFPMVPDQRASFARAVKMAVTPGFIAFKKQPDGSMITLHTRSGVLGPPERFLDAVLKAAAAP